jgi:hypothetical protein
MKRFFYWSGTNGLFATAMYFAFAEQVQGAANLVMFYVWFLFIVSCAALVPAVWKALAAKPETLPPKYWRIIDVTFDTACLLIFVWQGWFVIGTVFLLHVVFMQAAITAAKQHVFDLLKENNHVSLA